MYGSSGWGRRDTPAARPTGRRIPGTARQITAWVNVPDAQSVRMMRSLAIATDTRSPMAGGRDTFTGVSGHGVHRFAGRLQDTPQPFIGSPISPVSSPTAIRVGAQGGPSSMPGLPSTGVRATSSTSSIAAMTRPRVGLGG